MAESHLHIDLHRHLEGSHSAGALVRVAAEFQIKVEPFFDLSTGRFRSVEKLASALTMRAPTDDARVFYELIKVARAAYVSEAAIASLARQAFVEAAEETAAFEMRVSLFSMTRTLLENERADWRKVAPVDFASRAAAVLAAVLRARDEAQGACGKTMLVRLGFSRTFESEPHYRALADAVREQARALCGMDVLGIVTGADREPLPPALWSILEGLRGDLPDLTVHAGEFEGHASVERTLDLRPQAIGHGVHAVQSEETMARLAREGVTLELCPHSNRMLIPTAVAALERLRGVPPLVALQRASVHCVLGSDDPTPLGSTFASEWEGARAAQADMELLAADVARRWGQLTGGAVTAAATTGSR
jgi:Adenosine deaminase